MYNKPYIETGLGQVTTGQSAPSSTWQNILNIIDRGVSFGFNVAEKIRQIKSAQEARKRAEEQARMLAQMQIAQAQQVSVPAQPMSVQAYTGPSWGTLALIGGGIVLLAFVLKR